MSEFAIYLKKFLEKNELKIEVFADKVGVSFGLISHYVTDKRKPSYKFLEKFFNSFNISEKEKKEVINMIELEKIPVSIKKLKNIESQIINETTSKYLKLDLFVQGHLLSIDDVITNKKYIYEGKTLESDVHKDCFFIKLDSEKSLMPRGGYLLIDPLQKEVINLKVYLIEFQDKEYLKRIVKPKIDSNMLVLKSLNDGTDDIYVQKEEIRIKGRAIKFNYEEDL